MNNTLKLLIKTLLTAGLMIVLPACEKTIFVELEDTYPRVVMNGLLTPNYGLWLNVSASVPCSEPSSTSYKPVTGAIAQYYQGDDLIASIISSNQSGDYYATDFKPLPGQEYRITVASYGMPEASAVVTVPFPVSITGFDTAVVINHIESIYGSYDETQFFVDLSIPDPEYIQNYYMLGLFYLENGQYLPLEAYTEDINMNIYIQDGLGILAWNDQNFDGQAIDFTINFHLVKEAGFETDFRIILYSIEEAYFKYLKTYSQNFTILNEDALLFEPVQVSSNIAGGYGIIAAYSSHTVSFGYTFRN